MIAQVVFTLYSVFMFLTVLGMYPDDYFDSEEEKKENAKKPNDAPDMTIQINHVLFIAMFPGWVISATCLDPGLFYG